VDPFELAPPPPPRAVPLRVRSALLFGGAFGLFGWVFFAIGSLFGWVSAVAAFAESGALFGVAFGALFGVVGFVLVLVAWRSGRRAIRVLSEGVPARARVAASEPTGTRVNDQPMMEIAFEFEDATARHRVGKVRSLDAERYPIGAEIPILYVEDEPNLAEPLHLHAAVRLDATGVHPAGPLTGVIGGLFAAAVTLMNLVLALGVLSLALNLE
jgi:hypothetical protein